MKFLARYLLICLFLCSFIHLSAANPSFGNGLVGWATYNDLGQNGTTGGSNGTVVRVTTKSGLEQYANATGAYTILVEGTFTGSGMVEVGSDKTIIGVGSGATFDGFGLNVNNKKNIIIRNLTIKNANPDGIAMRTTHHVWIDHCDLSSSDDGLLDFTIGSDYLTVSWTKFHDHDKVTLANSGTQHYEDAGKNKVTYHHNWFCNTVQRNPRVGYGMGHVFNNYYTGITSYCVGYHTGASVLVENNYFKNSKIPLNQMYTSIPTAANYADAKEVGNIFDNTSGNTKGTGISFDPSFYYNYGFALESAIGIPAVAESLCGPKPGLEYEIIPTPANGALDVASDALTWTKIENVISWEVWLGTNPDSLVKFGATGRTAKTGLLQPNTEYFWKVVAVRPDTTLNGPVWRFKSAPVQASKPYPANGEQHARLRQATTETACTPTTLTWKPGMRALSYRVYLGESPDLTEADFKAVVYTPAYSPGALKYGKTYYWKVTTKASDGKEIPGDVWSFCSDVKYSREGITEMEHMVLNGRAFLETQDGVWFKASNNQVVSGEAGPGTMSSIWDGPDAKCTVSVSHFDESDGNGWFGLYVNETKVSEWLSSTNSDKMEVHPITNVELHKGDEIRIAFYTNSGELNRTDLMQVTVTTPLGLKETKTTVYEPDQELTVQIFSLAGTVLRTYTVRTDALGSLPEITLENQNLPQGLYLWNVRGNNLPASRARLIHKH